MGKSESLTPRGRESSFQMRGDCRRERGFRGQETGNGKRKAEDGIWAQGSRDEFQEQKTANGYLYTVEVNVSSQFSVSGRDKGLLSNGATMQAHGMRNTGGEDTLQSTDSKQVSRSMQPSAMAVITLLFYML